MKSDIYILSRIFWRNFYASYLKFSLLKKKIHTTQRRFQGWSRGVAPPIAKSGGCEGPPCASHPPYWSSGGCRGPPCDIWHFWQRFLYNLHKNPVDNVSSLLSKCFNIVIFVWFLTPLLLLVIKFLFIF